MRRRGFVKALAAIPAAPALLGQTPGPAKPQSTDQPVRPLSDQLPVLTPSVPDAAAEMTPRFFSAEQLSALRKVSEMLMPATGGAPGALEAKAPEFLDFLLGQSPASRQHIYRAGLDALNQQSMQQ